MTKQYTRLNHPEPEDDGTFLYDLFLIIWSMPNEAGDREKQWEVVARGLTLEQTNEYVAEHGEWEPTPSPQK